MIEEKKKNKLVGPFIIVLLLLLGCIGFILYDKGIILKQKEEPKTEKKEVKKDNSDWKDIDNTSDKFYDIYSVLFDYTYDQNRAAGYQDFSNDELATVVLRYADVSETSIKELENKDPNLTQKKFTVDVKEVDKYTKKLFGEKAQINYQNLESVMFADCSTIRNQERPKRDYGTFSKYVSCGMGNIDYDDETKTLTTSSGDCGCTTGPHPKLELRKIVSAKEKDGVIIMKEKAIYYDTSFNDSTRTEFYHLYSDKNKVKPLEANIEYKEGENKTISIENYLDKASTIVHTYKLNKKTGEYYFAGSKIE